MKPSEQSSDSGCLAASHDWVIGYTEERLSDLAVAEASNDVLAAKDSREELGVVGICGIEAAVTSWPGSDGLGHPVQRAAAQAGIGDACQGGRQ